MLSELFVELVGKLAEGEASDKQTTEGRQVCVANNAEGVEHRLQKTTDYRNRCQDANSNFLWNMVYNTAEKKNSESGI